MKRIASIEKMNYLLRICINFLNTVPETTWTVEQKEHHTILFSRYIPSLKEELDDLTNYSYDLSLLVFHFQVSLLIMKHNIDNIVQWETLRIMKLTKQRFAAADILTLRQLLSKKDGSISVYCKLMDSVANMWFDCDLYGWKTFMCKLCKIINTYSKLKK